jgi:hypothetical protein
MKVLTRLTWGSAKFWLGAIVVVVAALAVARDAAPANAVSTEILPSLSNGSPDWASTAMLLTGGSMVDGSGGLVDNTPCVPGDTNPTTLCLYVWAKNVSNTTGASAFNVHFTHADDRIAVGALTSVRTWLGSSGRGVLCGAPVLHPGDDLVVCNTILPPPPYGATGSGVLATIALSSKSTVGFTTLDFSGDTYLLDTPPNLIAAQIPATVRSINLFVAPCADFTGDGIVRAGDILYVQQRYGTDPSMSRWDPAADLDANGIVKATDILIAQKEYGWNCRR